MGEVLSEDGGTEAKLRWWDIPGRVLAHHGTNDENAVWMLFARRARRGAYRPAVFYGMIATGILGLAVPNMFHVLYVIMLPTAFLWALMPALRFASAGSRGRATDEMLLLGADALDFDDALDALFNCSFVYAMTVFGTAALVRVVVVVAAGYVHYFVNSQISQGELASLLIGMLCAEMGLFAVVAFIIWSLYWTSLRYGLLRATPVIAVLLTLPPCLGIGLAVFVYLLVAIGGAIFVLRCRGVVQEHYPAIIAERLDRGRL